jgi:transcription initiation factor IIE alpha subunit
MNNSKKYRLNFNMGYFNYTTGFFENNDELQLTRAEAIRYKWKCEKCSEKFQSYKMVHEHKALFHSY